MVFLLNPGLEEGRSACFEALVQKHEIALYRVAWRLCGNRDDAEDLIQDTLIEALQSFVQFAPGTHFDRWLFRIMRNTFIDKVRRKQRVQTESIDTAFQDADGISHVRELVDMTSVPDRELLESTLDGPIQDALNGLPEDYRMVVILADIEEMSYEEISQIIGCPIGTVRSRLHRGRSLLKDKLKCYVRF